jgi:hypothetical protein
MLKRLIAQGEDPDSADYTGVSALHAAASSGHVKIVELLIKAGAKVDKRDINVSIGGISLLLGQLSFSVDDDASSLCHPQRKRRNGLAADAAQG